MLKPPLNLDLDRLIESIAQIVRRRGPLCAACLTNLTTEAHCADAVDVRVAVVHLALGDRFTSGETCGLCGESEKPRNPVLSSAA